MDYSVKEIDIEINLAKYWLVLKRRWTIVLVVACLTTSLTALFSRAQKPVYQAQAKLLFESSNQTSSIVGLEGASRELKALTSRDDPLDTQVEIFKSLPIAKQVIEDLQIKTAEGELIKPSTLLKKLSVKGVPGTDVLLIKYTAAEPELAANVVNSIVDVYIQNDAQLNQAAAIAAQDFIQKQLPETERTVNNAEFALQVFKKANGIIDLDLESERAVEVLSDLDVRLTDLEADLAESEAKYSEIQKKLRLNPQEAYIIGLLSETSGVQEVLSQLQEIQAELSIGRSRYRDEHPEIDNLYRQEANLKSLLQERIDIALGDEQPILPSDDFQSGQLEQDLIADFLALEVEQVALQRRIDKFSSAKTRQQERALLFPDLEKRQRELERQLNAAQSTYETLLENFQQAQVLQNQNAGNARIVSPAIIPETPLSAGSQVTLALIAGGGLGVILGIMLAFLVEQIDRRVKTVREGQALYAYPLLGVIPAWKKLPAPKVKGQNIPYAIVQELQNTPIIEAYQALQANLKFSCLDKTLKTIVVTSAVSGEGRSEVTANLALTLSRLGHRVLIIDADMRNPVQHNIWQAPNLQGLTNVVAEQISLQQAIIQHESHLHILPVGTVPPNPLAILESSQTSSLLQQCKQVYDYIIVDTPAVFGLADTLTLGRVADGVLIVMQPGVVDFVSLSETKSLLAQSQQRVLGIVANGITDHTKSDQYFAYNQEYIINQNQERLVDLSPQTDNNVSVKT